MYFEYLHIVYKDDKQKNFEEANKNKSYNEIAFPILL